MTKFYKVNVTKLQIRSGPGTNYGDIGDLFANDVIEVTETLGGWHHITAIKAVPVTDPASWCAALYTVEIASPVPTPEPEPPAVRPLTITVEGPDYKTVVVTLEPK